MSYLLYQSGGKLLQSEGGYGILLERNNSRLSKVVAWENRVPFPIRYCTKCRTLIPANNRDYLYCERCSHKMKIVAVEVKEKITKEVSKVLSNLRTTPTPPAQTSITELKTTKKVKGVYATWKGSELHISIDK